jgi:HEAT repeat protein
MGIGPGALLAAPVVLCRLRERPDSNAMAVRVLGNLGAAVPEGLAIILRALESPDFNTRWQAVEALRSYRPLDQVPLPPLIRALSNEQFGNRYGVAQLLGLLGTRAVAAIPDLQRLVDAPERTLRRFAQSALNRIERAVASDARRPSPRKD